MFLRSSKPLLIGALSDKTKRVERVEIGEFFSKRLLIEQELDAL